MEKVLIVDDEFNVRFALEAILAEDYEVLMASNGEEAIRVVRETRPGIVLLDLAMPGMNGMEVLEKIMAIDPTIKVIVITGNVFDDYRPKAVGIGAKDVLTKPFGIEEIRSAMSKALHPSH